MNKMKTEYCQWALEKKEVISDLGKTHFYGVVGRKVWLEWIEEGW